MTEICENLKSYKTNLIFITSQNAQITPWGRVIGKVISEYVLYVFGNRNVHYRIHNSLTSLPVLSQMNPFQFLTLFPSFDFNLILPRFLCLPSGHFMFSNQNLFIEI